MHCGSALNETDSIEILALNLCLWISNIARVENVTRTIIQTAISIKSICQK